MVAHAIGGLLFDFLIGFGTVWGIRYSENWYRAGWILGILYVIAMIGQYMEKDFVTVGLFIDLLAFGCGGLLAVALNWLKKRKSE